jgi:hypothetical protein
MANMALQTTIWNTAEQEPWEQDNRFAPTESVSRAMPEQKEPLVHHSIRFLGERPRKVSNLEQTRTGVVFTLDRLGTGWS